MGSADTAWAREPPVASIRWPVATVRRPASGVRGEEGHHVGDVGKFTARAGCGSPVGIAGDRNPATERPSITFCL